MLNPTSKKDLTVALLVTVAIHVGFFFAAAGAVANDLIRGKIEPKEKKEKKKKPAPMQIVYEDQFFVLPEVVEESVVPVVPIEKEELEKKEPEKLPEEGFVQTKEDQETDEAPEETNLIGERDTKATTEEDVEAGDEKMTALKGEEERKSDPKTFDSNFNKGDQAGPSKGNNDAVDAGRGDDQVNQKMVEGTTSETPEMVEPAPAVEETKPAPKPENSPSLEDALAALEEEIAKEEAKERAKEPAVPRPAEPKPQPKAQERREAANRDGGFAPRTRRTRVAGVINATGKGSLNVTNTPVGRYQAQIFKKLESAWQMKNLQRRSYLFPGSVTLYFAVQKNGKVNKQRQVARVGASDLQWGLILDALREINIPKMPKDVIKELKGDPLEIIVNFNY